MRFLGVTIAGFVAHLAISGLIALMAFGAGMRSFTYDGPTGASEMWTCFQVWNYGPVAFDKYMEANDPLTPPSNGQSWPPEFYEKIEKRITEERIVFVAWAALFGLGVGVIDYFWLRGKNHRRS